MPNWSRHARLFGRLASVIAVAVWGYRLMTRKRAASVPTEEPSQAYMSLRELLRHFRSEDIARCLRQLGLPTGGNKRERIDRLIDMAGVPGEHVGWVVQGLLSAFREDDLRRVCLALGIQVGDKASMVELLAARVDAVR